MGRPRGSTSVEDKPASDATVRAICRLRFTQYFGKVWAAAWADQLLGDDALSIAGILRRSRSKPDEQARKELAALRSRALAACKAADLAANTEHGRVLRRIVRALPAELLEDSPSWARPRKIATRTRVAMNAPRVFGRRLSDVELAVVGILAGVKFALRKGESVSNVLSRERNAYASRRRR